MRRNLANGPRVTRGLALAAVLAASQPVAASSLEDLVPPQLQQQGEAEPTADDDVTAYAADGTHRYRRHRHWHHARHHREHEQDRERDQPAAEAPVEVTNNPGVAEAPVPASSQPTLKLVFTTDNGGDAFEQLMTSYYWSHLNHAIPAELIFEPAQRPADRARSDNIAQPQWAASLTEKLSAEQISRQTLRLIGF